MAAVALVGISCGGHIGQGYLLLDLCCGLTVLLNSGAPYRTKLYSYNHRTSVKEQSVCTFGSNNFILDGQTLIVRPKILFIQ